MWVRVQTVKGSLENAEIPDECGALKTFWSVKHGGLVWHQPSMKWCGCSLFFSKAASLRPKRPLTNQQPRIYPTGCSSVSLSTERRKFLSTCHFLDASVCFIANRWQLHRRQSEEKNNNNKNHVQNSNVFIVIWHDSRRWCWCWSNLLRPEPCREVWLLGIN